MAEARRAGWVSRVGRTGLGLLWLAVGPAWALNLEPGEWETRANVYLPGASFPLPVVKSTRCLTAEDPIPNAVQVSERQRCRVTDRRIEGDEVRWRVLCEDADGVVDGRGRVVYGGGLFEGEMRVTVVDKRRDRRAELLYQLKGARKGPCRPRPGGPRQGREGSRGGAGR